MIVRNARLSDAAQIARVHVETWRVAYRGQMPDSVLDALDVDQRARFWEECLSCGSRNRLFVAELAGAVAGFVDVIPSRDKDADPSAVAEIAALYVLPEHWRKGLGRALCLRAIAEAREQGFAAMTLWVLGSNIPAHRFYEAIGFALDGGERTDKSSGGATLRELRFRIDLRSLSTAA